MGVINELKKSLSRAYPLGSVRSMHAGYMLGYFEILPWCKMRMISCNINFCSIVALISRDTHVTLFDNIMTWWTIACILLIGTFRFHAAPVRAPLRCHEQFSFSPSNWWASPPRLCTPYNKATCEGRYAKEEI